MKGQGRRICVLRPSHGLGGGIEAYIEAVLEALDVMAWSSMSAASASRNARLARSAHYVRDRHPAAPAEACADRLRARSSSSTRTSPSSACCSDPSVGFQDRSSESSATASTSGAPAVGSAAPGGGLTSTWSTVSSFTAGAFAPLPVRLLPPGIPSSRYQALVASEGNDRRPREPFRILSVFRLGDATIKGAEVLADAVQQLVGQRGNVQLTFAGHGPAPPGSSVPAEIHDWITVVISPTTEELIALYATANVFALATLMLPNSGEGFGIVLAEAQLAGCVVVAPPLDGSADAILPGVTGLRPIDSSARLLPDVLLWCLDQPDAAARIASNPHVWSTLAFPGPVPQGGCRRTLG